PGTFRAELSDPVGVDVDIHLMQDPVIVDDIGTGCIARAHETLEVTDLDAGEYFVVIDSWADASGSVYEGEYDLAFEWIADDAWSEVPVAEGITWSRLRSLDLAGGDQTVNLIEVDPGYGWDAQPADHGGCDTVASTSDSLGAVAGINGGFFSGSCSTLDLLKSDGTLHSTNTMTGFEQRSMGWNGLSDLSFAWIDTGVDWGSKSNAMGGFPSLVTDGTGSAEARPGESVYSSGDWSRNPRTAVGVGSDGQLMMVTVDGRTSAGDGMTTPQLAELMEDLGAVQALGLDGGGSTTMTVEGCWLNDVVNNPSDDGSAGHGGARPVGSGLYIR
ncbi:MAG: phosphodiester glycosidase family protein, partial [Myxococcota bacterium]